MKKLELVALVFLILLASCSTDSDESDDDNFDASVVCPAEGTNAYGMPNRGTFVDERDGQEYKYTTIGNQVWMAENLRYVAENSKCYDDKPENCEIYGRMYSLNKDWEDYAAIEGKTVFIFEGEKVQNYSYVQALKNHGVNVIAVKCNNSGHDPLSYNPLKDNIFAMLDGDPTNFINNDNYTFTWCVDVDNNVWEEITPEELKGIVEDGSTSADRLLKEKIIKVEDLFTKHEIKIEEIIPEEVAKRSYLKEIESRLAIDFKELSDPEIYSSMSYVSDAMANLRTQISSSSFLDAKTLSFGSTGRIPGCISVYINKYYDIMGQLMESLIKQTESVISVAQSIVDMDIDLKKKSEEELGEVQPVEEDKEEIQEEPVEADIHKEQFAEIVEPTPTPEPEVEPTPKIDPEPTPVTPPTPTPEPKPTPVTPPTPTPEPEPTPVTPPTPTPEPEPVVEPTPEPTVILPEVIVGDREDGSRVVAMMDGNSVIDLKYLYEYSSEEEATSMLQMIQEKYKEIEYIKEIKVVDNRIEITLKEEVFKGLDIDTIISRYF